MLTTVTGSSGRTPVTRAPRWRSSSLANATPPGAVPWCLGIKSLCYILLRTEGKRRGSQLTQCSIRNCICGTVRTQPPNGLNGSAISSRTVLRTAYAAVVATLNVWITEHKGRWRASVPAERTPGSRRRGLRWHRCCGARWSGETGRCLRHESAIPERPGRTHHQVIVCLCERGIRWHERPRERPADLAIKLSARDRFAIHLDPRRCCDDRGANFWRRHPVTHSRSRRRRHERMISQRDWLWWRSSSSMLRQG